MAEIIRAEHSGFCFGVKRAIDIAYEQIELHKTDDKEIFTCGQLIHNKTVTDLLESKGIKIIKSIDDAKQGSIEIGRAHV